MLANDSKTKYPSFRIDDILNNDFRSSSSPSNDDQTSELNYDDKFDQPINLSSLKLSKNELETNQFKNLKSISSVSSSPLSVGSNSPSFFHNQFSPNSKSPVDQLIKCNLNDNLQQSNRNSELNNLKPLTMNSSLCYSDEQNHSFVQPSFFNPCSQQAIEDFYLKLNKSYFENCTEKTAQADNLSMESSLNNNLNDALKKIHQDYQAQHLANNSLLDQIPFSQLQKDQFASSLTQNFSTSGPSLNHPNPSFYMQQFYIRMKMLMNAKPRKGGQIRFNHTQTNELETLFNVKKYLVPSERKQIAKKLSLSERQVKTWFQNRRAKQRRSTNYRT